VFDAATGEPTHLTNGVCLNSDWEECNNNPWPGYFDYTFTTVAPIQRSSVKNTKEEPVAGRLTHMLPH
jgi:hypothetical protein